MKHYVYYHIDPITSQVKYVGKGSGHRAYETRYRRNPKHLEWLSNLEKNGLSVRIEIPFRFDSESEAYKKEKELIAEFRLSGSDLLNMLPGGDPGSGSNNPMYGKKRPDKAKWNRDRGGKTYKELYGAERAKEIGKKISRSGYKNGMFGKNRKDLSDRNKSQTGKTHEEIFGIQKANKIKEKLGGVKIIRNDGIIFYSIKSAAKATNSSRYLIGRHLNGYLKSVNGYTFQYVSHEDVSTKQS